VVKVHRVKVELLREKTFSPFGQVIAIPKRPADFHGGGGSLLWNLDFQTEGRTQVNISRVPTIGMRFKRMERHLNVTQTFIPFHGSPSVVAVAVPTHSTNKKARPTPDQVRAFLIDGTKGYLLKKGTWHTLDRFPLYPPHSDFVSITDWETAEDLTVAYSGKGGWKLTQEVNFEDQYGVIIEFALTLGRRYR
jgi:ureidoglycolate hydrolase